MVHRLAWVSVVWLLLHHSGADAAPPEKLLPASTQIYVHWDGIRAHQAAYDNSARGMMYAGDTGKLMRHLAQFWFNDYRDTMAVLDQLDLIITVDTSVAHLAGAMGRPVWIMLPFAPDWRWLLDRPDTPWYPTIRLFRQRQPKTWGPVMDAVVEAFRLEMPC